jgi:hypothetical protein
MASWKGKIGRFAFVAVVGHLTLFSRLYVFRHTRLYWDDLFQILINLRE